MDSGGTLALVFCILSACSLPLSFVPFVGGIVGLSTLILLVIVLVKFHGLKGRITDGPPAAEA